MHLVSVSSILRSVSPQWIILSILRLLRKRLVQSQPKCTPTGYPTLGIANQLKFPDPSITLTQLWNWVSGEEWREFALLSWNLTQLYKYKFHWYCFYSDDSQQVQSSPSNREPGRGVRPEGMRCSHFSQPRLGWALHLHVVPSGVIIGNKVIILIFPIVALARAR